MGKTIAQKENDMRFIFLQAQDMYGLSIGAYTADNLEDTPMAFAPTCIPDRQIVYEVRKACVTDRYPYLWRHEASFFYVGILVERDNRFFSWAPSFLRRRQIRR